MEKFVIDMTTTEDQIWSFFEQLHVAHDEWLASWQAECAAAEAAKTWSSWPYSSTLECAATVFPWTDEDVQVIIDLMKCYQRGAKGVYLDYLCERLWNHINSTTMSRFGHPRIYFK